MSAAKQERTTHPKPLILVAGHGPRLLAITDALSLGGFRTTAAQHDRDVLEQAQLATPDAIVIDDDTGRPNYALLHTISTFSFATPIILITGAVTPALEHEALRAGAWAVFGTPLDVEGLLLRLALFAEPKRELERTSEECLFDRISGLYNHAGLTRRAQELAALVTRHGLSLACAVFRPVAQMPNPLATDRLARAFRRVGRVSDALGRTGHAEFAVFAPATNTWAAARLVRRMTDTVERAFGNLREDKKPVGVRAGYSTAQAAHQISPTALLAQARSALEATP